jgi:hypothetical protein
MIAHTPHASEAQQHHPTITVTNNQQSTSIITNRYNNCHYKMKRSWRLVSVVWLMLLRGVNTAPTWSGRGRKLSNKAAASNDIASEFFRRNFCRTFEGAAGCATATRHQVIPRSSADNSTTARIEFGFNEDFTIMDYSVIVDSRFQVKKVGLYCGFAGTTKAGKGTLLAELQYSSNAALATSYLKRRDLQTKADDSPVDCEDRAVSDILTLFDLMVDGTVFFEVSVPDSSSDDTKAELYSRGQIFL